MIRHRIFIGALAATVLGCGGDDERNDPAPPGMSAGSVTIGGVGSMSATTDDSASSGGGPTSPTTTVSTSMPTTDDTSATGDTLTGDTGMDTGIDPTSSGSNPNPSEPTSGITTFATEGP